MKDRENPPKRWPARDEVRALAREHSVEAMEKVIHLMRTSKSQFVAMNAARTVLIRGMPEPQPKPRFRRIGPRGVSEVNVKIAQFGKEKKGGSKGRDRAVPVVPWRRKGPRDAGDGDGAGVSPLQGQRPGVRDEP